MNASIVRSCLVSGVAMASVAGFVLAPTAPQALLGRPEPAVALTAHVEPLAAQAPLALVHQIPDLINQQVTFHIDFVADFVATGAVLVDRQLQIPGALVRDIQNGTPLPAAVGRALQAVVEIELDAGRELIGFAVQYVDFQIRFIAQVVEDVITASTSVLAAVGDVITPKVAAPGTRLVDTVAERVATAQPADTARDDVADARNDQSARPTMSLSTPDDKTTVSAQGEIRSGATKKSPTTTSDENAPAQPDNATESDTTDQPQPGQTDSTDPEQHQQDAAEAGQNESDPKGTDASDGDE